MTLADSPLAVPEHAMADVPKNKISNKDAPLEELVIFTLLFFLYTLAQEKYLCRPCTGLTTKKRANNRDNCLTACLKPTR
ncbi:MAG: hypothetical protein MZV63_72085 [Marinilabiliales bacterium]|nr:hypothetical protein [Marinilabiliales bacterium]